MGLEKGKYKGREVLGKEEVNTERAGVFRDNEVIRVEYQDPGRCNVCVRIRLGIEPSLTTAVILL